MIDLYTAATPNGHKISIALEELALPYEVHALSLSAGEQKRPAFLAISPNGRIPAIVDRDAGDFAVFESGAILVYLAEKTGRLMPADTKGRSRVMQWLMFQMGGIGPMMGQANVFFRYLPEKIPLAINRYQGECRRLFRVLDGRLKDHEFLANDAYSIADIANWAWVRTHRWSGVEVDDLPHLKRWLSAIRARPAVQRGVERPPSQAALDKGGGDEKAQAFAASARAIVETGQSRGGRGMKLHIAPRAPNPRRVQMFMAEKGGLLSGIELVNVDLNAGEHRGEAFRAKSPLAKVPALELDDGRVLSESRAICTYLEGLAPEPNLMGRDFDERAFIEMADRRAELYLMFGFALAIRHTHPGLAPLEKPQFPEFGRSQGGKVREVARWFDAELARHPFIAGERFTIADITAFCAIEFARGLLKFHPAEEHMPHLQAWRDRIAERPSAKV